MSRTWLIAWVARYMTERLIRRSLSQPPAASGACRTREPSPAGMLLRIAERSSGLVRAEHVDPRRQTRARSALRPSLKSMTVWPSWSRSPERSGAWSTGLAVDERPVGRAEIDDPERVVDRPDLGVSAGNLGVVEPDGVRVVPAQGHGLVDFSSNRFPWSAPWMTNKEATEVSSPRLKVVFALAFSPPSRLIDPAASVNPSNAGVPKGPPGWLSGVRPGWPARRGG